MFNQARRTFAKILYEYLARRFRQPEWSTMNYGYMPVEVSCPVELEVAEKCAFQLYWHVATSGRHGDQWSELNVLEISSGRGGGASFIARNLQPSRYVALDFSRAAISLAQANHSCRGLEFIYGDAENLCLAEGSFDIVLNVESSHSYRSVSKFLSEAHRVLRPGGELLFADMVLPGSGGVNGLMDRFSDCPLHVEEIEEITSEVLAALDFDEKRKTEQMGKWATWPLSSFARSAYAMKGSSMRRDLEAGRATYQTAVLRKEK